MCQDYNYHLDLLVSIGAAMRVKHVNEVESEPVKSGNKTTIQVLISSQEGPNFAMRRFVIQRGGGMPRHTNTVEHEQYVLKGHASVGINNQTYQVKAGDVVFIPEGAPHWYQNNGDEDFEFLCVIPNKADDLRISNGDKEC
jgi:quercetin dioxygenase-like cupin family protein